MSQDHRPLMERLKQDTLELHERAEKSPFEGAMFRGMLPQPAYLEYLAQRMLVHRALENLLRGARAGHPALAALADDRYFMEAHAAADLRHFGLDPAAAKPLPSTDRIAARMEEKAGKSPVALLGCLYVFLGSTNGARFIARSVRKAYGLDRDGTRFLDPYGDEQPMVWKGFKDAANAHAFDEATMHLIVETAKDTFLGIIESDQEIFDMHCTGMPIGAPAGQGHHH